MSTNIFYTTLFRKRFIILLVVLYSPCYIFSQNTTQWEQEIMAFEVEDNKLGYPERSILFMGSSSIRLWKSLAEDMAPYTTIKRGFGGSTLPDVIFYADRILAKHTPCAVVLFIANDITGNTTDKSPVEVAEKYAQLIQIIRKRYKEVPVFVVAITPTRSRWKVWPQIRYANEEISTMVKQFLGVTFIPTEKYFLNENGLPQEELFIEDQLHLSTKGYDVWKSVIRPYLDDAMKKCP